ncbi:MAG: hypothetical protein E7376_01190 [Clostridiales bacterium]|nr:hypothetical protein [Clostridiales bacterium]
MSSDKLFYEENKKGKQIWLFSIILLTICFVGWSTAFLLSFFINPQIEGYTPNNFHGNLQNNVQIIITLLLILALIIFLFVFRFKSKRFKQTITITEKQIIFELGTNKKQCFDTKDFVSHEIMSKIEDFAVIKVKFRNNEITIKTRKYNELRLALAYIKNEINLESEN